MEAIRRKLDETDDQFNAEFEHSNESMQKHRKHEGKDSRSSKFSKR